MKNAVALLRLGVVFAFMCSVFVGFVRDAYANILITPTLVVFEEGERFSVVTLVNNGEATKSYEMDWVYLEMLDGNGGYARDKAVPEGMADLSDLVVFSPRRVTLTPGSKQKIRLAFRRPAEIADGDYHMHLRFKVVPDEIPQETLMNNDGQKKASVNVAINISYTIPVVVRVGDVAVDTTIEQISLGRNDSGQLSVTVPVRRNGDYSVLGYLRAYHIDNSGNKELVGQISNANLFREISYRDFVFPLSKEVTGGVLNIELRSSSSRDGEVYAERSFPLQ